MKLRLVAQLFRSAREFFQSSVSLAKEQDLHSSRGAALHLGIALELLAKAHLAIENPDLIVRGGRAVTESQFMNGDFNSIGMEEAFAALEGIAQFRLSIHQKKVLRSLRNLRNRIVHLVDIGARDEVLSVFVAAANLFLELHNSQLADWEAPYGMRPLPETVCDLTAVEDFAAERLLGLKARLSQSARPETHHLDECSRCLQDAVIIDGEEIVCLFCGLRQAIEDFARLLAQDGSVDRCPECSRLAIAKHEQEPEPTYECFCCGYFSGPELRWADNHGPIPRLRSGLDQQ